ncbi:hypothetical protein D3C73_1358560 [compost metagenome]
MRKLYIQLAGKNHPDQVGLFSSKCLGGVGGGISGLFDNFHDPFFGFFGNIAVIVHDFRNCGDGDSRHFRDFFNIHLHGNPPSVNQCT